MDSEITETLSAAQTYLENLNSLKAEIYTAEQQVCSTFKETERNIKETFSNLKNLLLENLDKREKSLLKKAEDAKCSGLRPLTQCAKIIEQNISSTNFLINYGQQLSHSDLDKINEFLEKGALLGNLPEVPEAKEVPYLSFYYEPFIETDFKSLCLNFGEVFSIAPIQIKALTPKPGAILIEWQQSYENDERVKDIQKFRLQKAFGDVKKDTKLAAGFIDCYTGLDFQYLLRDIQICQPYSFRICCKFDGTSEWSPWSISQVGSTSLKWFSWKATDGAVLTNGNKIASLDKPGKIIFSDGAQVSFCDSVEFTIVEVDPKSECMLALIKTAKHDLNSIKNLSEDMFLVDSNGKIFINNAEKSTVLPKFARGLKVSFSLERTHQDKVRVNVDLDDKRVTYDWLANDCSHLYFACQMMSTHWKVMVE